MDHYHRRGQNRLNDADSSDGGNSALATEVFDHFCTATTLKNVLGLYREMCDILKLRPTNFPLFYPRLKSKLRSWKAQALWKRLDIRAAHKCYDRGRVCLGTRVLVIGAGPCGLRAAIEAQLLGAKVVVIEKRDRITRNNVLHLWPFVIQDLRALGAKKFFGKFCAGAIDHISIRQLQCILLKVALLLGVELHEGVSFEKLISPTSHEQADRHGWRADVLPADHPVSHYEFDVLIGADGKRNTLEGFKRKEFRGKLAIAITANFKNRHTEAEARVEEISGVAFIFNQKFFKDLYAETGIDLENIVYYKDDTHYFVMTAKKHSLIEKGVIMQDLQDTAKLLAQENVDRDALMEYAREAAEFSTNYQLPDLEFAVNHYGQPDVAMFDFTSMYAAENASRVVERYGYRLLMCLVGDSLLEPFWPTGSGCARGFLSSLDSCWAIRSWGSGSLPLEVLAERESIYRLLGQTTPENLQRDYASYTLDPSSRYPNLNRFCVIPAQVRGLYDSDDPSKIEIPSTAQHVTDKLHGISDLHKKRRKRDSQVHPDTLLHWIKKQVAPYESIIVDDITESFNNGLVLCAVIHRYRPDLIDWGSLVPEDIAKNNQLAFDILEKEMGIPPVMTGLEIEQNTVSDKLTVLSYLSQVYDTFHGEIPHIKHLRLDIREELKKQQELISVRPKPISEIKLHTKDLPSSMSRTSNKYTKTSHMLSAERKRKRRSADKGADREQRTQEFQKGSIDENFSGRIKNIEQKFKTKSGVVAEKKPPDLLRAIGKIESTDWNIREIEKKMLENKMGKKFNIAQEKEKVPKWSREQFVARQSKLEKKALNRQDSATEKFSAIDSSVKELDKKLKEGSVLEKGIRGNNKVASMAEQFNTKPEIEKSTTIQKSTSKSALSLCAKGGSELCHFCGNRVYLMERLSAEGRFFHRGCFRCQYCATSLRLGFYSYDAQNGQKFYCPQHFGMQGKLKVSDKTQKLVIKQSINTSSKEVTDMPMETVKNKGGKTPERIEFSNSIAVGHVSENEEPLSQIDEDEWTDRNFGQSTAEAETSDTTDSDSDEVYDDAFEAIDHGSQLENTGIPLLNISQKKHDNSHGDDSGASDDYDLSSDGFSYYEYSSDDDDASETATEEEEEIKAARELRKQEVQFSKPPPTVADTDTTGSDTEVASDEESETEDSATEISTDSEFKLDGVNLQKDFPEKVLNERNVTKVSQKYLSTKRIPTKIKCNAAEKYKNNAEKLRSNNTEKLQPNNSELNIIPIVPDLSILATSKPLLNPHKGFYFLNRTHSTEGIASKVSLELKKQYLLGTAGFSSNIQKSGSASTLDSKLKSFHSNISEHQKLLNPSSTITPSMQAFLDGVSKLHVPLSPTQLKVDKLPDLTTDNFKHVCGLNSAKSDSDCDVNSARIISTASPMDTISVQVTNQSKYDSDNDHKFSSDTIQTDSTVKQMNESINDVDARPRSPAHETSIIVPEIPWVHSANKNDSSDDLETDSLSSSDENNLSEKGYHELSHSSSTTNNITVPRLEIIEASEDFYENPIDDIVMDSLHSVPELNECISPYKSMDSRMDAVKDSINDRELNLVDCDLKSKRNLLFSEPKTLNQPKVLASVTEKLDFQDSKVRDLNNLHINNAQKSSSDVSVSSSSSVHDITATVLTETELSDWARDGTVSDNLEDVEFKFDPDYENTPKRKKSKSLKRSAISATNSHYVKMVDFDGVGHICGKENTKQLLGKPSIQSDIIKNIADLDSIEFMDTASEESGLENLTSATNFTLLKNQGYVQFINVSNNFNKLESNDLPRLKSNEIDCKNDQVSRNVIDSEDDYRFYNLHTNYDICQKLSVDKVDTENDDNFSSDFKIRPIEETHHSNDLDQDSLQYSSISTELQTPEVNTCSKMNKNDIDYIEHVERLKNKMCEFNNAKDSIDVKKSKSKNNSLAKDFKENIRTEIPTLPPRSLNLSFILDSNLSASEKLKEISKERSKEKDLIHEMVMDNFRIQKKLTPGKKFKNPKEKQNLSKDDHETKITFIDKKNTFSNKGQSSEVVKEQKNFILQKSLTDTTLGLQQDSKNSLKYKILEFNPNSSSSILSEHLDTFSLPDVHSTSFDKNYKITNSLLKSRKVEQKKMDEQMHYSSKQSSQQMNIIKSLLRSNPTSPRFSVAFEDEIVKSKSNDTFHRSSSVNDKLMFSVKSTPSSEDVSANINVSLKSELRPNRTKSFSEISKNKSDSTGIQKSLSGNFLRFTEKTKVESYFKSEPCLLDNRKRSDKKNKNKDGEKKKSIIQAVTDFFYKRRDFESPVNKLKLNSSPVDHSKDKFSFWISPKSRDKLKEKHILTSNASQTDKIDYTNEAAPPPVPPPPIDYIVMNKLKSDDELNLRKNRSWSIETLEVNENLPGTCDNEKKKIMRRSHHKRLRLAQEIQRKLEETEVKTRELESRGVELEKVLRGEKSISETREESVLLAEWLSLMRERAALRRYERELLAKAEDLRLEEKHSILQAKLHDRSSSEPPSNKNQHADESELFDQMLDIVSKRDSLASLLEKNQQRYMKEDEDLEALILSKGLKTASIKNVDDHKS